MGCGENSENGIVKIVSLESVDSTNEYAKQLAKNGAPEGTVVTALLQTAGKGRNGRSFFSPENLGIYMSLIVRPDKSVRDAASMTAIAAVAVCRAIEKHTGLSTAIKWVNDVYINGKKVCGILTEGSVTAYDRLDYAIIGIGINIGKQEFEGELKERATSIENEGGNISSGLKDKLIHEIPSLIMRWLREETGEDIFLEYAKRNMLLGRDVNVYNIMEKPGENPLFSGIVTGISNEYGLIVKTAGGETKVIDSGEVRVR